MNDSAPLTRLDALRLLERVQLGDLERTRRWIAAEERRRAERAEGERRRPAAPDWMLEVGIGVGKPPVAVHVGGCRMSGKRVRALSRDEARQALAESVRACTHCRPDTELGMLE
ncbi:DUF6233 domain-containing protein [Streptomyces sp. NPDC005900]|uniref:DUF6233 domain-containing protein n=1 Tax=Streptomyces sp. NPDC005900 TaxID=3154569 RepID=UPI0033F9DBE5